MNLRIFRWSKLVANLNKSLAHSNKKYGKPYEAQNPIKPQKPSGFFKEPGFSELCSARATRLVHVLEKMSYEHR